VTAVALAIASAALFGAMTVLVRIGLRRVPEADLATLATILPAFAVSVVAALVAGGGGVAASWPFALAGLLAPGGSQILFTFAVRTVGASRTSVVVGGAPLVAVAIALLALREPVSGPLLAGAVLIVGGGAALASERSRPEHLRAGGLALAAGAATLFAIRDNLVRRLSDGDASAPAVAAAATLFAGVVVAALFARRLPSARTQLSFLPAGLCFGLSYVALFEAYYRGRVSVVSPLVATETLWGVGLSALLLRRSELVGRRLLAGAALIVAGGALIGVFR
jgi:drug/metabolite transporter (DMT)-like permease